MKILGNAASFQRKEEPIQFCQIGWLPITCPCVGETRQGRFNEAQRSGKIFEASHSQDIDFRACSLTEESNDVKISPINHGPSAQPPVPRCFAKKIAMRPSTHGPQIDVTTKCWPVMQLINLTESKNSLTSSLEQSNIESRHPINCPPEAPREFR